MTARSYWDGPPLELGILYLVMLRGTWTGLVFDVKNRLVYHSKIIFNFGSNAVRNPYQDVVHASRGPLLCDIS